MLVDEDGKLKYCHISLNIAIPSTLPISQIQKFVLKNWNELMPRFTFKIRFDLHWERTTFPWIETLASDASLLAGLTLML